MKFRPELSTPSDGSRLILVYDDPSREYLLGPDAYKTAAAQAAAYGFGGALTQDPITALIDAETDKPVVNFDPAKPTSGWRAQYPFVKPM